MKKLMFTMFVAVSAACAMAADEQTVTQPAVQPAVQTVTQPAAQPAAQTVSQPAPSTAAAAPKPMPKRRPVKFDREKYMARIKAARAERVAKVSAILKNAGIEEAKIAPLAEEINKVYMRPPRPPRAAKPRPNAANPDVKPEAKPETKPEAKPEQKTAETTAK